MKSLYVPFRRGNLTAPKRLPQNEAKPQAAPITPTGGSARAAHLGATWQVWQALDMVRLIRTGRWRLFPWVEVVLEHI